MAAVTLGAIYTVATLHYGYINRDLSIRGYAHDGLQQILDGRRSSAHDACGPVSVPTYKLIPDTRWILNAPESDVIARTETNKAARMSTGVAIIVLNNRLVNNPAYGPYVKYASNTGAHDSPPCRYRRPASSGSPTTTTSPRTRAAASGRRPPQRHEPRRYCCTGELNWQISLGSDSQSAYCWPSAISLRLASV